MYYLGEIYENVEYAHADREQALLWYRKAGEWGDDDAAEKVEELEG